MSGGRTQHSQMDPEVEARLTELLGVIGGGMRTYRDVICDIENTIIG